jgi:hypothetical protein
MEMRMTSAEQGLRLQARSAGGLYLLETGTVLLASSFAGLARQLVVITAVAGEGGLSSDLLIRGVRSSACLEDGPREAA